MFRRTSFSRLTAAMLAATALAAGACSNETTASAAPPVAKSGPPTAEIAAPATIANFTLSDQNGQAHELYKVTSAKAIVMVLQGVGCPIVQQLTPDIKDLQATYEPKGVMFLMLNANNQDTPAMIANEAKSFEIKMPILKDVGQKVAEPLGVVRTAETFVIQPGTWKILYHGPLSDRLTYGRAKAKADNNYAADAIEAVLAGKTAPISHAMTDGCLIDFPARTAAG